MAEAKKQSPFALRVEDRAPLSVLVSRQLRKAIVSGRVSAGTEFPSEKQLTEELGVSRSTVREALRILQAQGLLSGGDTVSTRRPRVSTQATLGLAAAQAMENAVLLGQVPLRDLVELRVVIEGAAVEAAAEADEEQLGDARDALRAMKDGGHDLAAFRTADLAFHRALAVASGNAAYPLVMGVLRSAIASHLGEALAEEPDPGRTITTLIREHGAILRAVARGDGPSACRLMTRHIRGFYLDRAGT